MPIAHLWHATSNNNMLFAQLIEIKLQCAMCRDPGMRGGLATKRRQGRQHTHAEHSQLRCCNRSSCCTFHTHTHTHTGQLSATAKAKKKIKMNNKTEKTDIPTLSRAKEKVKSARIDLVGSRSHRLGLLLRLRCIARFEWAAKKLVCPSGRDIGRKAQQLSPGTVSRGNEAIKSLQYKPRTCEY